MSLSNYTVLNKSLVNICNNINVLKAPSEKAEYIVPVRLKESP